MKKELKDKLIVFGGVVILLTIIALVCLKIMKIGDSDTRDAVNELQTNTVIVDNAVKNYINSLNSGKKDTDGDKIIEYLYENNTFIEEIDEVKHYTFTLIIKCNDNTSCITDDYTIRDDYLIREMNVRIKKSGYNYIIDEIIEETSSVIE